MATSLQRAPRTYQLDLAAPKRRKHFDLDQAAKSTRDLHADTFWTSEHGTPASLLRCELAVVGYREIAFHPLTGSNAYLAIFAPPSDESRTRPDAMIACTQ
jgi:hypothetical protein